MIGCFMYLLCIIIVYSTVLLGERMCLMSCVLVILIFSDPFCRCPIFAEIVFKVRVFEMHPPGIAVRRVNRETQSYTSTASHTLKKTEVREGLTNLFCVYFLLQRFAFSMCDLFLLSYSFIMVAFHYKCCFQFLHALHVENYCTCIPVSFFLFFIFLFYLYIFLMRVKWNVFLLNLIHLIE